MCYSVKSNNINVMSGRRNSLCIIKSRNLHSWCIALSSQFTVYYTNIGQFWGFLIASYTKLSLDALLVNHFNIHWWLMLIYIALFMYRVTIICIMCGCLFDCFFFVFFLGQLYLGNGSSHCSTYAIRWLCLVNCVMWRVCAAGCAREWVVLIIVGHRELIT